MAPGRKAHDIKQGPRRDYEERKGLLSEDEAFVDQFTAKPDPEDPESTTPVWSPKKLLCTAIALIVLLVCGAFARILLMGPPKYHHLLFHGDDIRSNGTHEFKRTVLMVSIDGLR